jgi:predicted SAM-dependent methyltransferase
MKKILQRLLKKSPFDFWMSIKHFLKKRRNSDKVLIRNYLMNNKQPKLQIGCGHNLVEKWLNTDLTPKSHNVAFLDASKKFPFQDCTFNFIYSEHIFEHLDFKQSCNFLSESYRVLAPNGVIRIAIPHIDFLFNLYQNPEIPIHKEYVEWATERFCKDIANVYDKKDYTEVYVINNFYRDWGHQVLHNYESLSGLLSKFNFSGIERKEIGISDFEALSGMELHGNNIPDKFNKLETLVVEARKAAKNV